jgi:tetratricopeptide (TPR) repeat protein
MYRDAPLTGPICHRHEVAPAVTDCTRCRQPLCEPCIVFVRARSHCHLCARTIERRRSLGFAVALGGSSLVLLSLVAFVVTRPRPFDYGLDAPQVELLRERVEASRCDRAVTREYEELMAKAGDAKGAIADSDAFFARCGDWFRLRWVRYGAFQKLGLHVEAAAEATRLMELDPDDFDYPWWRGIAYEQLGRVDDAIADYRKTLALLPSADRIPFNLSALLEQKKQLCEARQPIAQFLSYHPELASRSDLVGRLERLTTAGHCPPLPPLDPATGTQDGDDEAGNDEAGDDEADSD